MIRHAQCRADRGVDAQHLAAPAAARFRRVSPFVAPPVFPLGSAIRNRPHLVPYRHKMSEFGIEDSPWAHCRCVTHQLCASEVEIWRGAQLMWCSHARQFHGRSSCNNRALGSTNGVAHGSSHPPQSVGAQAEVCFESESGAAHRQVLTASRLRRGSSDLMSGKM